MNEILIIILFNLCLYFPALKCLIIVDDIRWFKMIKEKEHTWAYHVNHYKNVVKTQKNILMLLGSFLKVKLYSGGTFGAFEDCPVCNGTKTVVAENKPQKCARCKGEGRVEKQRKYFGRIITAIQIDHAFAIALQCLICVLMYWDFHSIWACLLFASSSITTHIAVWLNGRRYAVNIILTLLIVACIKAGGWWVLMALPLYAITPAFHMTAFFAPVLYPYSIPLMFVLLAVFWDQIYDKVMTRLNSIFDCDRKYWKPKRVIVIIKTYGFYFFKMIMPLQTRTCYGFLYMWGETPEGNKDAYDINVAFGKGCIALFISFFMFFFMGNIYKPYVAFFILSTLQWCNIINATQITADRYACMPLVFMSVILAHFLPWQVCLVMVVINACFTSMSYRMYENVQGMFDYHFYHWPNITLVNKEYIAFCIKSGNYIKAYTLTRECLRYNPTDFALLHAAAVCARVSNDRVTTRQYVELASKHLYYGQEEVQKRWIENFKRSL